MRQSTFVTRLVVPLSLAGAAFYLGQTYLNANMPSLSAVRASNTSFKRSYPSVAVVVGGTSGTGRGMAEVFGQIIDGNGRVIIIGRNRAAAEAVISSLPKSTIPGGATHEFIECDVARMKNVQAATQELLSRVPKINYLVMTPGFMTLSGRDETEEGIDKKLAVHYYARWKFTQGLLPLLKKANEEGEDAKVLTVLAAGHGGEVDLSDLGLKKSYSTTNAALAAPTYNDLMIEEFASQNPELTFVHAAPGAVRTNLISSSPSSLLNKASPIISFLGAPFLVTPEVCGQYLWGGLLNATKGVTRMGSKGQDIGKTRYFGSEEARKKLWEHTWEATKVSLS